MKRAVKHLKHVKAGDVDALKNEGETAFEGTWVVCMTAWKTGCASDDWTNAATVPLYKGKGRKN